MPGASSQEVLNVNPAQGALQKAVKGQQAGIQASQSQLQKWTCQDTVGWEM